MKIRMNDQDAIRLLAAHEEMLLLEVRQDVDLVRVVLDGVGSLDNGRLFAIFDFDCVSAQMLGGRKAFPRDVTYSLQPDGQPFVLQAVHVAERRVQMFFGTQFGTLEVIWRRAAGTVRRGRGVRGGVDPAFVDIDDGTEFTFFTSGNTPWLIDHR